jgi:peroxiredoxin
MMYRLFIALSVIFLITACDQNKNNGAFELKGKISGSNGETLYLEKLTNPQPVVVDSAVLNNDGEFEFKNYLPKLGFYRVRTDPRNMITLVLDSNVKISITADIKDFSNTKKIVGSAESTLFYEYEAISKARNLQLDSLDKSFQMIMEVRKFDSLRMDSVSRSFEAPYNVIMNRFNSLITEKIKQNNNMYASMIAIQGLDPDRFGDTYRSLADGLLKKYPKDKSVMMFRDAVNKMLGTTIGSKAPEIVLPSPDGKEIALSSLRGKVVLIDFWASWCGPCRKEMPNVVRAYAKYKSKGFEIYGVSLDKEKGNWVEAIKEEGITWPQVSDLLYWQSSVISLYAIEGIPYTVLLDREGTIIAKNLRGEELDEKLAEVLK